MKNTRVKKIIKIVLLVLFGLIIFKFGRDILISQDLKNVTGLNVFQAVSLNRTLVKNGFIYDRVEKINTDNALLEGMKEDISAYTISNSDNEKHYIFFRKEGYLLSVNFMAVIDDNYKLSFGLVSKSIPAYFELNN